MKKINVITLGCSKNTVDSEHLMARLAAAGYEVLFDSDRTDAKVVVINTCGFIGDAKQESVDMILRAAAAKNAGKIERLFVIGCLSERYADSLRAELPEGLGRTQALLVLQTEETVSSLLNEGRLVADAPDTLPATLAQAIAGVPLREIPAPPGLPQRNGIHYLEPDARSERWQAALRSGALGVALFPLCGPALPGHLRLLYLRN